MHQDGVSIRRRRRDLARGQGSASPRDVLDHDLLSEGCAHGFCDEARAHRRAGSDCQNLDSGRID